MLNSPAAHPLLRSGLHPNYRAIRSGPIASNLASCSGYTPILTASGKIKPPATARKVKVNFKEIIWLMASKKAIPEIPGFPLRKKFTAANFFIKNLAFPRWLCEVA